jgi:hypothetical protein
MATQSPVAFLLVKFQGSNDEPISVADAKQMFTAAGRGTMNVVDWFDDNSHGQIDMTGNVVFGWLTLPDTVDGYRTNRGTGTYGRTKIIDLARDAATAAGISLWQFVAVVAVTNVEVDLFGGSDSPAAPRPRRASNFGRSRLPRPCSARRSFMAWVCTSTLAVTDLMMTTGIPMT